MSTILWTSSILQPEVDDEDDVVLHAVRFGRKRHGAQCLTSVRRGTNVLA